MVEAQGSGAIARRLARLLEPVIGAVYFAPECHEAYAQLGFGPSVARAGAVQLPDGPAYFTSRGSCLGQVPGEVVAAAFGVFNPEAVIPSVSFGWTLTDAPTIARARLRGAAAQLERVLGDQDAALLRATALLQRMAAQLQPASKHLFAGLCSLGYPGTPWGDFFRAGDRLREYRGDSHNAAWVTFGLDATEIGLLTELYLGLPMGTYIRTRAWSDEQIDAAKERLTNRGLIAGEGFTPAGAVLREAIEVATDRQLEPAIVALGSDAAELFAILEPWGQAMRDAGAYLAGGADDLARRAAGS